VKTFIQGPRATVPGTIISFGKLTAVSERAAYDFGFRRDDPELHAAFRVVLRKLFALLIRGAGLPVINWHFFLSRTKRAAQNWSEREEREFCFHDVVRWLNNVFHQVYSHTKPISFYN
jgi:hypothetical protein